MAALSPVAYPIAKLLDVIIRGEISHVFSRKELKEFIVMHATDKGKGGELDNHEVEIMSGALEIGDLTADQVCTPMEKVQVLNSSTVLDQSMIQNIARDGHSRIPVADNEGNIIGILLLKSLLLLEEKDKTQSVEQITKDTNQSLLVKPIFVHKKEKLDDILSILLKNKKQLAFVIDHEAGTGPDSSFASQVSYCPPHNLEDIKLDKLNVDWNMPRSKSYFVQSTRHLNRRGVVMGLITMEDVTETIMHQQIDDEVDALRKEKPAIYGQRLQNSQNMVYTSPPAPEPSQLRSPSVPDFNNTFIFTQENGNEHSSIGSRRSSIHNSPKNKRITPPMTPLSHTKQQQKQKQEQKIARCPKMETFYQYI